MHAAFSEASLDPLVTIDATGRISDANAATEEVTGIPRSELIGTDFPRYFTDPAGAEAGYQQVFQAGTVRDYPSTHPPRLRAAHRGALQRGVIATSVARWPACSPPPGMSPKVLQAERP